jgi:cellobiose-specific phosphotransferase system component IIC
MFTQILLSIIIITLLGWLIKILFSKSFWKSVGGHVVDGIAKKFSKIIIFLIILSVIALLTSILNK